MDICGPSVPRMLGLEGQDIHSSASVTGFRESETCILEPAAAGHLHLSPLVHMRGMRLDAGSASPAFSISEPLRLSSYQAPSDTPATGSSKRL